MTVKIGLLVALAVLMLLGGDAESWAQEEEVAEVPPVHADHIAIEQAVLDTTTAFLHEDGPGVRRALDVVAANCRILVFEDEELVGRQAVVYDGAFHSTLNRARELVTAGELDESFSQFMWIQRSCISCHRLAREAGALSD